MTPVFDCTEASAQERDVALDAALGAIGEGQVVVLPTDTVYGIGADPFHPQGVSNLLAAKRRGRSMPPPVLVPNPRTVDGLATQLRPYVRRLISALWPGPLTIVVQAQPSLAWDLGDTNGTVALRMPDHDLALRLLARTGPLAVTSANLTGQPAATTVLEAATQLGPAVEVYLDGGPTPGNRPSTIVDCTRPSPVILRLGVRSVAELEEALGPEVHLRLSPAEPEPPEDQSELEAERARRRRDTPAQQGALEAGLEPTLGPDGDEPTPEELAAFEREEAEQAAWAGEVARREGGEDGIVQAHAPTESSLTTLAVPVPGAFDVIGFDAQGNRREDLPARTLRQGRSVPLDAAQNPQDRSTPA